MTGFRRVVEVRVYDDLPQAGGTLLGVAGPWVRLSDTRRTDGDDRLEGEIGLASPGASLITVGTVLQVTTPDGAIAEWIVQTTRDDLTPDRLAVTALSARVWLAERVLVRSGMDTTLSGTGLLSDVVDALLATTEWPAWVVAGTFDRDPEISYAWDGTNGLAALLALVEAANATEEVAFRAETMRLVFRRVSASQYALDFLTTAASGAPTIVQGKNLTSLATRSDRTQQVSLVLPIGASDATIEEAYAYVSLGNPGNYTADLRDWSYSPERLFIAYDGQWVGDYLISRIGTAYQILDSDATLQRLYLDDTNPWDFDTDAIVRIASDSGGTAITEVGDRSQAHPRRQLQVGSWTGAINWARNAQWNDWVLSPSVYPTDWTNETSTTWTLSRETGATFRETGRYSLKCVTDATAGTRRLSMNSMPMPDDILSPGGGTQTWEIGFRVYFPTNVFGVSLQRSVDGGSTWTTTTTATPTVNGEWVTGTGTFTTSGATTNSPQLAIAVSATNGTFYVDRVWMFRNGIDDADDTVLGCDPARGIYAANRALATLRNGAVTYEVGVADRTRDDPTAFPDDAFAPGQTARLLVPAKALDTTQTVSEVRRDLLQPLSTALQLGALRRRLTTSV